MFYSFRVNDLYFLTNSTNIKNIFLLKVRINFLLVSVILIFISYILKNVFKIKGFVKPIMLV
jgi:hypothetical protein